MSAPAITSPRPRVVTRRRVNLGDVAVEVGFRVQAFLVYFVLFLPIAIVVILSFNATNRNVTDWQGFSLKWYQAALKSEEVQRGLYNSAFVASFNAILATTFGTMAALGLQRVRPRIRIIFDSLTYISVIIPEIVIALASLVLFRLVEDAANPTLTDLSNGSFKLANGYWTIIAAHVLFNTSLVLLLVRARLAGMDRTHVEASYDLYATPWRTFRQITFPQLLPAIVAGFLLSFTFSFDDYVITSFVSGVGSGTLPLFIFGQTKQGVTPLTNAVASMMLLVTLTVLLVGQFALSRRARRTGAGGPIGGVAGIVAENAG